MADVIVRGMNMPSGCHDCKLRNMVGNCPIPMLDGQHKKEIWTLEACFQRPSWCPILCQLPEGYGRLIDADVLLCVLNILKDKGCDGPVWDQMRDIVENMVTIVPAERGSENEVC